MNRTCPMAMQDITTARGVPVDNHDEDTPLLPGRTRSWLAMRHGNTRKCVSSKSALLILLWSFVVGLLGGLLINLELYNYGLSTLWKFSPYGEPFNYGLNTIWEILLHGGAVILTCFFPLAGILADIKYGRYKTVVTSLHIVFLSLLPAAAIAAFIIQASLFHWPLALIVVLGILGGIVVIMSLVGLIGFTANVVQFGLDQLHDSPAEDSTLFIHWYVWTYYASFSIVQLILTLSLRYQTYSIIVLALIPVVVVMVLGITLCLVSSRRRWFLIEPGTLNPYKLVYRVTKFARQHKIPVQRSAFTYCEDELPSGLDLGKEKYGGCFNTEQVENVKAFYGILKVLFSFGIVFFLNFSANSVASLLAIHMASSYWDRAYYHKLSSIFLINGLFYPLMIVVCIPLYLCLLRPFISQYLQGMLKRMGIGMFLVLFSLMVSFSMDTYKHMRDYHNTTSCLFNGIFYRTSTLNVYPGLILIQFTLAALSNMMIYTAVFEFICSQSPHSMKGLLIGLLYAIRGLYLLLAIFLLLLFRYVYPISTVHHISCGFYYYLTNIVIGVVALLVYTCVAKRYRYRVRDELCNVHQYAENYYSSQQYGEEIVTTD